MNRVFHLARETSLGRFLIPAGIAAFVFGLAVLLFMGDTDSFLETQAVVTRTEPVESVSGESDHPEEQYDVYVRYTAGGREYEEYYGQFPQYQAGDSFPILYDPENPTRIAQPGNHRLLALALMAAGLAALARGVVSIVKAVRKEQEMKRQEEEWNHG